MSNKGGKIQQFKKLARKNKGRIIKGKPFGIKTILLSVVCIWIISSIIFGVSTAVLYPINNTSLEGRVILCEQSEFHENNGEYDVLVETEGGKVKIYTTSKVNLDEYYYFSKSPTNNLLDDTTTYVPFKEKVNFTLGEKISTYTKIGVNIGLVISIFILCLLLVYEIITRYANKPKKVVTNDPESGVQK